MDIDSYIRNNVAWPQLSEEVRGMLGGSSREYDKLVLDYSVRWQLRHKGNLVRYVKKEAEAYYDMVMRFSQAHLLLFPYHLADVVTAQLRITPFHYYVGIIVDMMATEKSYDSLPNFTAADVVRLLGIGRNQYIDLLNQSRSTRRLLLGRTRPLRDLLPQAPPSVPPLEPWYKVSLGHVLETDAKALASDERQTLDLLIDEGAQLAGILNKKVLATLFTRGLVYFDVPVEENDYAYVPPLDGFVMNRVTADPTEQLLYKLFVSLDDQSTVGELATLLHVDPALACRAVSLFCRLGFAKKRVTGLEHQALHVSWAHYYETATAASISARSTSPVTSPEFERSSLASELGELSASLADELDDESGGMTASMSGSVVSSAETPAVAQTASALQTSSSSGNRLAFVFDSSLAAFLMMGNLSASLKSHAVTLFEVGRLADEGLNQLLDALDGVRQFAEGEPQRYSEHATTLLHTLRSLRAAHADVDLLRGESLLSLDDAARTRMLARSYCQAVAMAPLGSDACALSTATAAGPLAFLGPSSPEVASAWMRLAIYAAAQSGPASVLLPKGTRLAAVPEVLRNAARVLVTTLSSATHEPQLIGMTGAAILSVLNEQLTAQALLVQVHTSLEAQGRSHFVHAPFPFDDAEIEDDESIANLTSVKMLRDKLGLQSLCGYIVFLERRANRKPEHEDDKKEDEEENRNSKRHMSPSSRSRRGSIPEGAVCVMRRRSPEFEYVPLDVVLGIPLFDAQLNAECCSRLVRHKLLDPENRTAVQFASRAFANAVKDVVETFNGAVMKTWTPELGVAEPIPPGEAVKFDPKRGALALDELPGPRVPFDF